MPFRRRRLAGSPADRATRRPARVATESIERRVLMSGAVAFSPPIESTLGHDSSVWVADFTASSASQTHEAERASITGGVVSRGHAGYKGTGFVDYLHASGDAVEFTVTAPSPGWYDLSFRHANGGSADRSMALSVNGDTIAGGMTLARTGSWTTWRSAVATVQLTAGTNTVRLVASGQSGPNLDSLSLRPSQSPTTGTYQAEAAVLSGAKVASDLAGYTGSGYADYQHASGDWVEFPIEVESAGSYTLDFRYANGGTTYRPMELRVDGQVIAGGVSFAPTGGWQVWKSSGQHVTLSAGRHSVRLTAIGRSGPNFDALTVRPAAPVERFFSTGFDTQTLHNALEDPDAAYVIGDGVIHTTRTGSDSFRRRYVRTKSADYFDNFVYEVTYSATGITFSSGSAPASRPRRSPSPPGVRCTCGCTAPRSSTAGSTSPTTTRSTTSPWTSADSPRRARTAPASRAPATWCGSRWTPTPPARSRRTSVPRST